VRSYRVGSPGSSYANSTRRKFRNKAFFVITKNKKTRFFSLIFTIAFLHSDRKFLMLQWNLGENRMSNKGDSAMLQKRYTSIQPKHDHASFTNTKFLEIFKMSTTIMKKNRSALNPVALALTMSIAAIGGAQIANAACNPCNPCAAKKTLEDCIADASDPCNPCNPCAAKAIEACHNPCNPCAASS